MPSTKIKFGDRGRPGACWSTFWQRARRIWPAVAATLAFIAASVGFINDAGGLRSAWLDRDGPTLALAFYEQLDDGPLRLLKGSPTVMVDLDDVLEDRIRFPVRLALSNRDGRRLEVVRVTVKYPADLEVQSAGRAQIDPTGRTVIYEHEIGVLEAVDGFTPIAPLDEIVVPFTFVPIPVVALAKDDVPIYFLSIYGAGDLPYKGKDLAFEMTIQAKDRPPVSATINYRLDPDFEILPQGSGESESRSPTAEEQAAFAAPEGRPVDEWSQEVGDERKVVHYRKIRNGNAVFQVVTVNGTLRRLIADTDDDGGIDYELTDVTGDGVADEYVTYIGRQFLVDWLE